MGDLLDCAGVFVRGEKRGADGDRSAADWYADIYCVDRDDLWEMIETLRRARDDAGRNRAGGCRAGDCG